MELTTLFIVCPLVFLAGFVDAIAGGGGLISLPGYLLAGLPPINAVATNKLSSSIGTAAATWRLWRGGFINFMLAIPAALLAIAGSLIGSQLALITPENIFTLLLVAILPLVATFTMRSKSFREETDNSLSFRKRCLIIGFFAFLIGSYDGFYGPGAGTFMLICFTVFAKLSVKEASGQVKAANLASNVAALVMFLLNDVVWIELGLIAAIFNTLGSYIGTGCMMKDGTKIVRPIIALVLSLLFIKIILEATIL